MQVQHAKVRHVADILDLMDSVGIEEESDNIDVPGQPTGQPAFQPVSWSANYVEIILNFHV